MENNNDLTEKDKNDIKRAFNLLIEQECDTVDYSTLFLKLGIESLGVDKWK